MAYTLFITGPEADLATALKVGTVEGSMFTYSPNDAGAIMDAILTAEEVTEIGLRLAGRIAELRGKEIAANAPSPEPEPTIEDVFDTPVPVYEPKARRRA